MCVDGAFFFEEHVPVCIETLPRQLRCGMPIANAMPANRVRAEKAMEKAMEKAVRRVKPYCLYSIEDDAAVVRRV